MTQLARPSASPRPTCGRPRKRRASSRPGAGRRLPRLAGWCASHGPRTGWACTAGCRPRRSWVSRPTPSRSRALGAGRAPVAALVPGRAGLSRLGAHRAPRPGHRPAREHRRRRRRGPPAERHAADLGRRAGGVLRHGAAGPAARRLRGGGGLPGGGLGWLDVADVVRRADPFSAAPDAVAVAATARQFLGLPTCGAAPAAGRSTAPAWCTSRTGCAACRCPATPTTSRPP